jgi:hypothetical protein
MITWIIHAQSGVTTLPPSWCCLVCTSSKSERR